MIDQEQYEKNKVWINGKLDKRYAGAYITWNDISLDMTTPALTVPDAAPVNDVIKYANELIVACGGEEAFAKQENGMEN